MAEANLRSALERGTVLYNSGRQRECAEVYWDAAVAIMPSVPPDCRAALEASLARARTSPDPSWTLRHALDYVRGCLPPPNDTNPFRHSARMPPPVGAPEMPAQPAQPAVQLAYPVMQPVAQPQPAPVYVLPERRCAADYGPRDY